MSDNTGIEWTDATWNPVTGCTKVSEGCDHCYAETFAERFRGVPGHHFERGFDVVLRPERLITPLTWKRPRRIFVNSMSDLFHERVPDEYIAKVFAVMVAARRHTFQVLTKRPGRMHSLLSSPRFESLAVKASMVNEVRSRTDHYLEWAWPAPNVWLGVSAENQKWANVRVPILLDTPSAVRFLSCEPLLGEISLFANSKIDTGTLVDWVIVGGESGPGARPMHPRWARQLRDECVTYGIPFLFKQRGEWTWNEPGTFTMPAKPYTDRVAVMHGAGMTAMTRTNPFNPFQVGHPFWATRIERVGKKAAGRELDGRTWDEYPQAVSHA